MTDLKDTLRGFYKECFDNRNLDAIDDFVAVDAIEHEAPPPGVDMAPGREGIKQLLSAYLDAFNPLTVDVHALYEDGDTVIARVTFNGTNTGEFSGMPPTGKSISIEGIDIQRIENGLIVEHWGQFDAVGMMTQLGMMPPME